MLKRLLWISTAAFLTVAGYAAAVELREDHPDVYVVEKGDTLWHIAGRFLAKPWLWPEIWQANPHIENPHLIYPGDVLSLAYLGREAPTVTLQRIRREPLDPVPAVPLSDVEAFLRDLRVVSEAELERLPYVVGLEEDRLRGISGQLAYVRGMPSAQPGQVYAIMRPTFRYARTHLNSGHYSTRQRDLNFRSEPAYPAWRGYWNDVLHGGDGQPEILGVELMALTTAQVTRAEGHGIGVTTLLLADEGKEVRAGDVVMPVVAQPYDLSFFPHPPADNPPYGKLRVMAVTDADKYTGPMQVIAISGGASSGIDNGMVFSIWREGSFAPDKVANRNAIAARNDRVRLPDEYVGHVMVFRTYDEVAYGLIMQGIKPTRVGYVLKHPDATR